MRPYEGRRIIGRPDRSWVDDLVATPGRDWMSTLYIGGLENFAGGLLQKCDVSRLKKKKIADYINPLCFPI